MGSLADGIWEKGYKQGYKQGYKRGLKIGEERVIQRAILKTYVEDGLNIMKSLKMGAEEALEAMGVPARSRAAVLKTINERLASES